MIKSTIQDIKNIYNKFSLLEWIVISLNIIGAYMVSRDHALYANTIWCFTNPYWIYHNYLENNDKGQAFQYFIYWGIAISGVNNLI